LRCSCGTGRVARKHSQVADALPQLGAELGLRNLIRAHLLVQSLRLGTWLGAEVRQRLAQPRVLAQRVGATTAEGVEADEARAMRLAQGLLGDQAPRRARRLLQLAARLEDRRQLLEHLHELQLELLARDDRPVLVAILGQQALAIELDGARIRAYVAAPARLRGLGAERVHVDPDTRRLEDQQLAGGHEQARTLHAEHAARVVQRLAQVRRGRRRIQVGPQDVHHLLALEPMRRRERQQLQQCRRLASRPLPVPNRIGTHRDAEAAQQFDPKQRRHRGSPFPCRPYSALGRVCDRCASTPTRCAAPRATRSACRRSSRAASGHRRGRRPPMTVREVAPDNDYSPAIAGLLEDGRGWVRTSDLSRVKREQGVEQRPLEQGRLFLICSEFLEP
jgi:hypothetical protein